MTQANTGRSLADTIAAIEALDLRPIKFKATRAEDGYGWTPQHADRMEAAYKRYLILVAKYPGMTLAPERDIDRFWHLHILDTRKYAADCDATFGHFLHHFPYLGLRGEDDAKALDAAFADMQALWQREFGEPMDAGRRDERAAWCSVEQPAATAAWCSAEQPAAKSAWCSVEQPAARGAWCSAESPQAQAALAAWCSVEVPPTEVVHEDGSRPGIH